MSSASSEIAVLPADDWNRERGSGMEMRLFIEGDDRFTLRRPYRATSLEEVKQMARSHPSFPEESRPSSLRTVEEFSSGEPFSEVGVAHRVMWLSISNADREAMKEVLSWLPIHSLSERAALESRKEDKLEYFPSHGYAFLTLLVPTSEVNMFSQESEVVTLSFIVFPFFVLCLSSGSFEEEEEVGLNVMELCGSETLTVGTVVAAYFATVHRRVQRHVRRRLTEANDLDELVLQVMPSNIDVLDLHERMREVRQRVSELHIHLLMKERVLQILLLPVMDRSSICPNETTRKYYQDLLGDYYKVTEKVNRGRDTVNMSSLSLMCGVCARLVQHCHHMDYINNVQGQIALIVMPVNVIPGVFAMNVRVPWEETESMKPFLWIVIVTLIVFCIGMIFPIINFFRYKHPGALASF